MIRGLERCWFMLALIRENLVFSWWYHWGKYNEIRKENTWDNSRGWVDLFMEFDPKLIYSFGMFTVILIVANIYYILWWLYGYSWIEFVIENEFKVILLKGLVPGIWYQILIHEKVIENVFMIIILWVYDTFEFKDLILRLGHVMPYFLTIMFWVEAFHWIPWG